MNENSIDALEVFEELVLKEGFMKIVSESSVFLINAGVKILTAWQYEFVRQQIEQNHDLNLDNPLVMSQVVHKLNRSLAMLDRRAFVDVLRPHSRYQLRKRRKAE